MPRKSRTKTQSSKVKIAASGDATVGGDVVGRDKIIQNIVYVGQFLDFAQVQGLLTQPSVQADYKSIAEAFEKNISARMDADLQQATAFAGEVLGGLLEKWKSSASRKPLPFRTILSEVPEVIRWQLAGKGYWEGCSVPYHYYSGDKLSRILWLPTLDHLWEKFKGESIRFGIMVKTVPPATWFCYGLSRPDEPEEEGWIWDIDATTSEEFRLMMTGVVLDLMRLESNVSGDVRFWDGLVDLMASRRKETDSGEDKAAE